MPDSQYIQQPKTINNEVASPPVPVPPKPPVDHSKIIIIGIAAIAVSVSALAIALLVSNKIALIVPKTSTVLISSPQPSTAADQLNNPPAVSQKKLVAENEQYQVYIFPQPGTPDLRGTVLVVNKNTGVQYPIEDEFSIFGEASILDDGRERYVGINTGTYVTRGIELISLTEKKRVASMCVMRGTVYFFEDLVVYANCDSFDSLPWGAGEAPSIVAKNLLNGSETILFQSSETNYFYLKSLSGSTLSVDETYVSNVKDWEVTDPAPLSKTRIKTYNLAQL